MACPQYFPIDFRQCDTDDVTEMYNVRTQMIERHATASREYVTAPTFQDTVLLGVYFEKP